MCLCRHTYDGKSTKYARKHGENMHHFDNELSHFALSNLTEYQLMLNQHQTYLVIACNISYKNKK